MDAPVSTLMQPPAHRRSALLAVGLAGAVVVGGALRFATLGVQSFDGDELSFPKREDLGGRGNVVGKAKDIVEGLCKNGGQSGDGTTIDRLVPTAG